MMRKHSTRYFRELSFRGVTGDVVELQFICMAVGKYDWFYRFGKQTKWILAGAEKPDALTKAAKEKGLSDKKMKWESTRIEFIGR